MQRKMARFEKVSFEQFDKVMRKEGCVSDEFIKESYDNIKLPKRATAGSAGYDFYLPFDIEIPRNGYQLIPTGIRCAMLEGWVLDIRPRSGHGFKYGIKLANTTGIIDEDYYYSDNEGHIMIKIVNDSSLAPHTFEAKAGQGIAQGLFLPYGITVDDDATEIRNGGFGSTTKE